MKRRNATDAMVEDGSGAVHQLGARSAWDARGHSHPNLMERRPSRASRKQTAIVSVGDSGRGQTAEPEASSSGGENSTMRARIIGQGITVENDGALCDQVAERLTLVSRFLYMAVAALWVMLAVSLFGALLGCGPMLVKADQSVQMSVKKGPPCEIEVKADGEVVSTVIGPKKCNVEVAP